MSNSGGAPTTSKVQKAKGRKASPLPKAGEVKGRSGEVAINHVDRGQEYYSEWWSRTEI